MLNRVNDRIVSYGPASEDALVQLQNCVNVSGPDAAGVLCADHHKGYGLPIGGVIASSTVVMPAGVGYDIGCGNYAVETPLFAKDLDTKRIMDEVAKVISFGMGLSNGERVDDAPVFDHILNSPSMFQRGLFTLAQNQLGTVGSGNHYVDLFEDRASGRVWIGVHFGSRGFGHKTATHYLHETADYLKQPYSDAMDAVPMSLPLTSDLAQEYLEAMTVAGEYANNGRVWVVNRVLEILGTTATKHVHNHHNYAWFETHNGVKTLVTRKGATPAFPGQQGFVGGSMGDDAVIIEGVESTTAASALYSAMHGAGRVMGRLQATGKWKKGVCIRPGLIDWDDAYAKVRALGVELRGGGADEAPAAYKRLTEVLAHHDDSIIVKHVLRPIGVAMAGKEVKDEYRD